MGVSRKYCEDVSELVQAYSEDSSGNLYRYFGEYFGDYLGLFGDTLGIL